MPLFHHRSSHRKRFWAAFRAPRTPSKERVTKPPKLDPRRVKGSVNRPGRRAASRSAVDLVEPFLPIPNDGHRVGGRAFWIARVERPCPS